MSRRGKPSRFAPVLPRANWIAILRALDLAKAAVIKDAKPEERACAAMEAADYSELHEQLLGMIAEHVAGGGEL